ncbi:MAG: PTS sugar transporter subunit IIC [Treponema sp.]|nr:PTS sugar transporter subunit IIC [Treponema sp.]MCL2251623.1 PTS sugar transporter subunit IIC [Treponema sp.]
MAFGLFATLIAGTIVNQIGKWIGSSALGLSLQAVGIAAQLLMGAGIGAGVANSLKAEKLVLFSAICAGFIGAQSIAIINAINAADPFSTLSMFNLTANVTVADGALIRRGGLVSPGDPVSALVVSIIAVEIGQLLKGKTKLDIVVLPLSAILISCVLAFTICPPIVRAFNAFGHWIMLTTETNPIWMGIVMSVSVGLLLTMPTSSAAICVACGIGGLAGGAAVVGGASHMICFAVMSWRENRVSGLIAQGLGTSMLQIPNIFKNPRLLIPPVLASAVCGPLAAAVFGLHCGSTGSGMGTSGLVGLFTAISASLDAGLTFSIIIPAVILLFFVIPAVFGLTGRLILGKINWIKDGDLKLEL